MFSICKVTLEIIGDLLRHVYRMIQRTRHSGLKVQVLAPPLLATVLFFTVLSSVSLIIISVIMNTH